MATSSSQLNIDTLKQKTGVTDTQLDQRIEQEQFWSLAGLLGSYDKFVKKPGFDLNNADIEDLKECASKNGNQLAMRKALEKWENVIRDFTYRSLLKILIGLREGALADKVCTTLIQTQASELNKEDTVSLSPAPGRSPLTGSPITDPIEPNSVAIGTTTADRIKEFDEKFRDLRENALEEITENGVTVKVFRRALMNLPDPITNENKDFITSKHHLFEEAKSIESIFVHLNFYLSFIDFSLLEHIIKKFGSDSLKRDMSSYAEDMKQFRMSTLVSEVLDHLPRNSDAPVGYSHLKVKFAFDVKTATLEEVDTFRKSLSKRCLLSPLALFLFDLQKSSLLVTWLVPAALATIISDQIHKTCTPASFLSNDILEISLEESNQRTVDEIKPPMNLGLNRCGLAIVVGSFHSLNLTHVLTRTLKFAVYEPQDKPSYMQAIDLEELKHHPIIVMVDGFEFRLNRRLRTDCGGFFDIKEDIMAPLFPPLATHLADNPKIFLFVAFSEPFDHHILHSFDATGELYIVGYIAYNDLSDIQRVAHIVVDELASPSMSVQEIFTSIDAKLPPTVTMTVINRLKEPVYLHPTPHEPELTSKRMYTSSLAHDTSFPTGPSTIKIRVSTRVEQQSINHKTEPRLITIYTETSHHASFSIIPTSIPTFDTEIHRLEQPTKKLKLSKLKTKYHQTQLKRSQLSAASRVE